MRVINPVTVRWLSGRVCRVPVDDCAHHSVSTRCLFFFIGGVIAQAIPVVCKYQLTRIPPFVRNKKQPRVRHASQAASHRICNVKPIVTVFASVIRNKESVFLLFGYEFFFKRYIEIIC